MQREDELPDFCGGLSHLRCQPFATPHQRQDVERRVLRAMRERFFERGAFAEFCAGFTEEVNRLRREQRAALGATKRELERVNREIKKVIEAIKAGFALPELKTETDSAISLLAASTIGFRASLTLRDGDIRYGFPLLQMRDSIAELDPTLRVELGFSEGLLESWAAREAFLLFCLLIDADGPTWRAWLGYKNSSTGIGFNTTRRNSPAYLKLFKEAHDAITDATIEALTSEPRTKPRGVGGSVMWDRAERFLKLREEFDWNGEDAGAFVSGLFDPITWVGNDYDAEKVESARRDVLLVREKALTFLKQEQEHKPEDPSIEHLRRVANRLRHQIATNEPLTTGEPTNLHVTTLWGAKGVTAEHVYILGVSKEALPGERRRQYPGTDADYIDEQRRLFYVSITRPKRTLVISRALKVKRGLARQIGLKVTASGGGFWANLQMSPFLHDVITLLPEAVKGESWTDCVPE